MRRLSHVSRRIFIHKRTKTEGRQMPSFGFYIMVF